MTLVPIPRRGDAPRRRTHGTPDSRLSEEIIDGGKLVAGTRSPPVAGPAAVVDGLLGRLREAMAVKSKRLRFEILKRDGFRCIYCGATPIQSPLHVDHVKPEADGGTDDPANLVTACRDCNGGKSSVPLEQRMDAMFTTEEERERADQVLEYLAIQRRLLDAKKDAELMVLERWENLIGDWPHNLPQFISKPIKELGISRVLDAVEIVARKNMDGPLDRIRYFCGILRSLVREEETPEIEPRSPDPIVAQGEHHAREWTRDEWMLVSFMFMEYWKHRTGIPWELLDMSDPLYEVDNIAVIIRRKNGRPIRAANVYALIDEIAQSVVPDEKPTARQHRFALLVRASVPDAVEP